MTDLRTAAHQALEALESLFTLQMDYVLLEQREDAITALRAALEQPDQEPVMWLNRQPLYAQPLRCANCASLEAQNTELDRKLADLEEALKEMLSVWEEDPAYGAKHADKARAAIAKVEGQA